jgi:hypothetical protein
MDEQDDNVETKFSGHMDKIAQALSEMNDKSLREQALYEAHQELVIGELFQSLSNTLKKRLDEKDIQAETFAKDIEQLRTRTDAQKTRHDELKRTLEAKHSELEDKEKDARRTAVATKKELQEAIAAEHAHTDHQVLIIIKFLNNM